MVLSDEGEGEILADYRENPTCLILYSQPTPSEGIAAEVVIADSMAEIISDRVSGRLVLTSQMGIPFSRAIQKAGGLGMISDHGPPFGPRQLSSDREYLNRVNRWHNYTIPPWDEPNKGFGFALSAEQGRRLRSRIAIGETVRLKAMVETRHYDGVLPLVSGRLRGKIAEEIAIVGHFDEFGADDNCSELAVGLESVRAILAMLNFDNDGTVTIDDYDLWKNTYGSTTNLAADGNGDGIVNAADYTVWQDDLGLASSALNGNGSGAATVVQADYLLWKTNFEALASGSEDTAPVPEPTTLLLALLALTAVPLRVRHG